jgi:hypothetical protein
MSLNPPRRWDIGECIESQFEETWVDPKTDAIRKIEQELWPTPERGLA